MGVSLPRRLTGGRRSFARNRFVVPIAVILATALMFYCSNLYRMSLLRYDGVRLDSMWDSITSTTSPSPSPSSPPKPPKLEVPVSDPTNFLKKVQAKFNSTIHSVHADTFMTVEGYNYTIRNGSNRWTEPLGQRLLILDADSRVSEKEIDSMLTPSPLNDDIMSGRTAGMLNHFLYALIHGYDYRLVKSPPMTDRHGTWSKVSLIKEALKTHDYVVFLDADATFQYYRLPYEWLMSMWGFGTDSLVAMPEDPNSPVNQDSKGWVLWNTGFITAQQSERTQEMFERWENCPLGERYPECKHWAYDWAHEQAAFGAFVRYEYEVGKGKDMVPIPCMDGNGANYIVDKKCGGVFVAHHWFYKDLPTRELYEKLDDSFVVDLQNYFHLNQKKYYVDASEYTYPLNDLKI
ncbi:hypothetical protein V2G26_004478 [Clonostachys chloroleuca]|uniref:Nucleotide-diphospho-sugar transferase domain-containing protein n=1 Tax=Clonostachys chloroleuca TaxID=1926264 RepID=A0AA35QCX4_9HYPO|nr:unnamed protein product [Clonostachys chloroleuca]